ncbi:uncharacterized protein LOC122508655 [Leptopilina heterotoma]|uniref:uncharacterized protein LOC122508655 n=1 Tax=Leptopilina heterotoma TaxID=63436 RepID=UPI001CA80A01|nr:uncharacterized protein LOC122508655 [Leptopilina heterotoma]
MDFCKKCLIIVAGISTVIADIDHELKRIINLNDAKYPPLKPWFLDDTPSYLSQPSETIAHYTYAYPYDNLEDGSSYVPTYNHYSPSSSSSDDSFYSSTKRIPNEDKNYKKAYTITNKESLPKSEPNCQEIKFNETKVEGKLKPTAMTCYNCKDLERGSTYEYCSYSSDKTPDSSKSLPPRFRRSDNYGATSVSTAYVPSLQKEDKSRAPYKFSQDYFLPDASRKFAIEHKTNELCQKMYKDSMVCTVCKNPTTGLKSEQCAHIGAPNDKAYSFSTSHSVGKPRKSQKFTDKKPAPIHESSEREVESLEENPNEDVKDAAESSDCRQVRKDSEICTVCKDPKTGGNSQRCTYNYEPDEKVYKFTRSKSFGYPESSKQEKKEKNHDKKERQHDKEVSESDPEEFTTNFEDEPEEEEDYSAYDNPEAYSGYESLESSSSQEAEENSKENNQNYDYNPEHVEYIRSESEKILNNAESENCHKVKKDSMICSVCKDPKTGEDSESCSYSYEPDDKKFAYTKSKSFGSPTKDEPEEYSGEGSSYTSDESSPEGSYAYASELKPTVSYPRKIPLTAETKTQRTVYLGETEKPELAKVDLGLLGASQKQAKMEQLLKDDRTANKTRCKKTMKNEMTCYQCVMENGLRQEECMYIKNPDVDTPAKAKEVQPAAASDDLKAKQKRKRRIIKSESSSTTLEPVAETTRRSYRLKRQSRRKLNDNGDETNYDSSESFKGKDDRPYETDPYEYVAETKYKYHNTLGLKLPSHTLEVSDYEKEFDDIFYGNRNN